MTGPGFYSLALLAMLAASLVAAIFHRAVVTASLARLEEINDEEQRYAALPDMHDARIATGAAKLALYAALIVLVAERFSPNGAPAAAYLRAFATSMAAVLMTELVALVVAGYHSGRTLYRLMPIVSVFAVAGGSLAAAGRLPASIIARLMGREAPPPHEESVEEEILDAVTEGEREGVIEDQEREMIESIIEFKDSEAAGIMTPRTRLTMVREDMTLRSAMQVAVESAHSRLPVAAENADNIVGILHVKDLLPRIGANDEAKLRVRDIMRAPYFVPETKRIREMLQELRATSMHMAIVLDEYGGTSGIVTIEDILEEIVGEIEDEYDEYQPPEIRITGPGRAVLSGVAGVHEVNEALGTSISEQEEYETIAGFVLFGIGRIPKTGEIIDLADIRFRVLDADERRIRRMAVAVSREGAESPAQRGA